MPEDWIDINKDVPPKRGIYEVLTKENPDTPTECFWYEWDYSFGCMGTITHWREKLSE